MYSETWHKVWCPKCNKPNWICNGDVSDCTVPDVEAVECWDCKHRFWLDEESVLDYYSNEFEDEDSEWKNPAEKLAKGGAMIDRGRKNPDDPHPGFPGDEDESVHGQT